MSETKRSQINLVFFGAKKSVYFPSNSMRVSIDDGQNNLTAIKLPVKCVMILSLKYLQTIKRVLMDQFLEMIRRNYLSE